MQLQGIGRSQEQSPHGRLRRVGHAASQISRYVVVKLIAKNSVSYMHRKQWDVLKKAKATGDFEVLTWAVNAATASFICKGIEDGSLELQDPE